MWESFFYFLIPEAFKIRKISAHQLQYFLVRLRSVNWSNCLNFPYLISQQQSSKKLNSFGNRQSFVVSHHSKNQCSFVRKGSSICRTWNFLQRKSLHAGWESTPNSVSECYADKLLLFQKFIEVWFSTFFFSLISLIEWFKFATFWLWLWHILDFSC